MLKKIVLSKVFVLGLCLAGYAQVGVMPPIGSGNQAASGAAAPAGTNGIEYHGGPVIFDPHVYFIWYGNWNGNPALTVLPEFISGLSGSRYFDTNTTYFDSTNQTILNRVSMGNQAFDNFSQGTALSDSALQAVVSGAIGTGALPTDPNGVYFVLTSADVTETSGFCTVFCGFHTHATLNGSDIKYAFVGNPDRCPSSCEAQSTGPNGTGGADGMANIVAHELNESITDPDLNAWFHNNLGGEVGDLCNFNFGPTFTAPNGTAANVILGGRDFLIQQNWTNFNGGFCGLGVGVPPPLNSAFVEQQYFDFLDRAGSPSEVSGWVGQLNNGLSRANLIQDFIFSAESSNRGRLVAQAYVGLLSRDADYPGFRAWLGALDNGLAPVDLAQDFIGSQEFQNDNGANLTNDQFVTVLYNRVLLRQPDPGGFAAWVSALNNASLSRGQVALAFLQSQEFQNLASSQNRVDVDLLYFDMLRRAPDPAGFSGWLNQLNSGVPYTTVISGFLGSSEYAARF